ncbi:uncharacterized protein [Maniola hyperantus]|uniref:uncharacterized protein isoform X2 n=1 Tax=Aphantopus hyperantus TaxID=2795564 RepID=UPI00374814DE
MLYKISILIITLSIHGSTCSRVIDTYTQALNLSDYCPRIGECGEGSHVMCLYNSAKVMGPACLDFLTNISITPDYAHFILSVTNRIRSKIANGQVKSVNGETFPKAYGMFRVLWDEELATFAQVWANQCTLHQDMCRSSKKFPHVGQALGMIRLSLDDWMPIHNREFNETVLTPAKLKYALKQVMKAWWQMKDKLDPSSIKMLNRLEAAVIHDNKFLNLIYGPLTHIGCGISVYKEYAYKDNMADLFFNCIQIVCNFSSRPKFGEPIYTVDPPKEPGYTTRCGCPVGYDEDEDCLCYETGRKIPYSCKDKDQCKPPVVVLPIFSVEDAPSSAIGDLTRRFSSDVNSRYFDKQPKMVLVHNTTKVPYRLADITHARRHLSRQKPSIFSRAGRFELPIKKRIQVTMNLVHQAKEFKKDVAPRKDFTQVKKLVSSYLDKKRHGEPFESDGSLSHGPVTYSDYNNATNEKLKENKNDVAKTNQKLTYIDRFNITKGELKQTNINPPVGDDAKLISLLDKLEEEVNKIDLSTHEKGMFDQKIRKIYRTLIDKPDLVYQKFKLLSKDSLNDTISRHINFDKLSEIDQTNVDKHGFNLNKLKHSYRDFENYNSIDNDENKFEQMFGNKVFNSEAKQFFNSDIKSSRGANDNVEERKFRNTHHVRKNGNNYQSRHLRTDDAEYYPLSRERRRYYHQKLANLQKNINNMKRSGLPKEVPEDRHIRRVRPTQQESEQRRKIPNNHINSYYMPDRARFLHGF